MSTEQPPKLSKFQKVFIWILTISAVVAPIAIINFNTLTFENLFSNQSVTSSNNAVTAGESVVINNVRWATRNVDAPGTFSANPEDAGMFYQWNRKIGWSATDPLTSSPSGHSWDNSIPTGTVWRTTNDPSPTGWRVPTLAEIQTLLDGTKVSSEWVTVKGINGKKFTDKATGNTIFLPAMAAGYRHPRTGEFFHIANCYWSNTQNGNSTAYSLEFSSNSAIIEGNHDRGDGLSIRCVAEGNINNTEVQAIQAKTQTSDTKISSREQSSYSSDIVGVWKGTYTEHGTNGKGNLKLTINDDMTGVVETTIKRNSGQTIKATYIVSVTCQNDFYNVTGKDFIKEPHTNNYLDRYNPDDFNGTISNGIFSGNNFKFEKVITVSPQSSKNAEQKDNKTTGEGPKQQVDYTAKVETALSNAINACENGNWDEAYKYYKEAASYPTDRSSSIKQTAAQKFLTKAKTIISNNNGECDDFSKQLLDYARKLYPSNEIQQLINKCN